MNTYFALNNVNVKMYFIFISLSSCFCITLYRFGTRTFDFTYYSTETRTCHNSDN